MSDTDNAFFNISGQYCYLNLSTSNIVGGYTAYYNCHAYAWHLTEGNTNKVWINNTNYFYPVNGCYPSNHNLDAYWSGNTGCFIECNESEAVKIHYECGNHSAVKSSVAGKYE